MVWIESTPMLISSKHFFVILSLDSCSVYFIPHVKKVFGAAWLSSCNFSSPAIIRSILANYAAAACYGETKVICVSFFLPLRSNKSRTLYFLYPDLCESASTFLYLFFLRPLQFSLALFVLKCLNDFFSFEVNFFFDVIVF